jgi:hypothetical protein
MVDDEDAKEPKMKSKTTPVCMAAGFSLLLIAIGVLGPLYGQLQQSGGAGTVVTASQGGTSGAFLRWRVDLGLDFFCTGEPADGVSIFPKKLGCMAAQSKITITFVAADVTTQIPALKA